MTSRERLLKVLNGQIPDRVPINTYELCGFNSKSFENIDPSYKGLMDYIRKYTDSITMYDPGEAPSFKMLKHYTKYRVKKYDEDDFHITEVNVKTKLDDLTKIMKNNDTVMTTWITKHFCSTTKEVDAYMSLGHYPKKYNFSDYKRIKRELGDNGIVMSTIPDPVCSAMDIMNFEDGLMWAYMDSEHFESTLKELHRRQMIDLKNMLDKQVVDIYRICGPEYMTPPYMSPDFFEKYTLPYISESIALIHSYGAKARVHSHGKIGSVLDMIIESGADAIDPCEAPPDGDITLKEVKEKCKGKMTVFGNIQLKLLENGDRDEVRNEVIKCMQEAKEDGGFIIMPTASPINLPLNKKTEENYKVFIDTALEYGKY